MLETNLAKKNSFNTFLNSYFNLFVVVLLSFLLIMSYFLILKPKVDKTVMAIEENISYHQKLLQSEKTKLLSLEAVIANYNDIDAIDIERVNRILPNDYDKELLYGEIEELITRNGFIPTSITLKKDGEEALAAGAAPVNTKLESKVSEKVGIINISLSIASVDYAGLKNLLNILESNLRLLDVKQLSLDGGSSGGLELATYFYKK